MFAMTSLGFIVEEDRFIYIFKFRQCSNDQLWQTMPNTTFLRVRAFFILIAVYSSYLTSSPTILELKFHVTI